MTNAEKYQEVFGFPPEHCNCPTEDCSVCPEHKGARRCFNPKWWDEKYKEGQKNVN